MIRRAGREHELPALPHEKLYKKSLQTATSAPSSKGRSCVSLAFCVESSNPVTSGVSAFRFGRLVGRLAVERVLESAANTGRTLDALLLEGGGKPLVTLADTPNCTI